ncbi:MAG: DUF3108 domain-containing protein [Bacteroidetes bacterium]|nr:DUF3108 domain-containing protein [Bacteroidota bacterium]
MIVTSKLTGAFFLLRKYSVLFRFARWFLLINFLLSFQPTHSQCLGKNLAFRSGEIMQFDAYYNWGLLRVKAGKAEFTTAMEEKDGESLFHIKATAHSLSSWDWFFKVRDTYETWVDTCRLYPREFIQQTSEGGYQAYNRFAFDRNLRSVKTFHSEKGKELKETTLQTEKPAFDVMSAAYAARSIDYSKMSPGDKIPINIILNNEIFTLYYRYLGKEVVKNIDGHHYRCLKFSAMAVEGTIFKGGEDLFVWVSDDQNHVPVKAESKILVGSVNVFLTKAKNLRYKVTCIVD